MAISLDGLMGFHAKTMAVREDKMEVIAGNLANANTPGYKARDIDFNDAMRSASESRRHGLSRTHDLHIAREGKQYQFEQKYRIPTQPDTGDGNTVEVQTERNAFLEASLRYQASVEFISGKIKGMKKALSGGQGA